MVVLKNILNVMKKNRKLRGLQAVKRGATRQ